MIFPSTLRSEPLLSMKTLLIKKSKQQTNPIPTSNRKVKLLILRVWKDIFGIPDLTKIRYRIRENARYLNGKQDFTATWEAGFVKIYKHGMRVFGLYVGNP